jgi:hypothetical protein
LVKVTRFVLAIILISLAAAPLGWTRAQDEWAAVGNGVDYREYLLPDPNHIYVARMDRANPSVTLEAALANGDISSSRESVGGMVQRYDDSLITWDNAWGNRANVVAAINGSYVDGDTGQALSGQVISGWYAKRYDSLGGGSGFAWTRDRVPFVGKCVNTEPDKQIITFAGGATQRIDGVNVPREEGELVLYTPQFGTSTQTVPGGVEVLVRMGSPAGIKPSPSGAPGTIDAVLSGSGSSLISYDHVVLSASGAAADTLINNANVGDPILISQELRHYETDCFTQNPQSWRNTYAAVSGAYEFLQAGEIIMFGDSGAINLHPRTAILFDDNYIYFLVVDGRDPDRSIGMTIEELAYFGREVLGATWGIAQDGGGSSTMVINGVVMNQPAVPCYQTYLPLMMNDSVPIPGGTGEPQVEALSRACQRLVANAMMMVEVMPPQLSSSFEPAMLVSATVPVQLRLGPGWNNPAYTVIPAGSSGSILDPANGLGGIYAKGTYWWEINFNGQMGWAPEEQLERSPLRKLPRLIVR